MSSALKPAFTGLVDKDVADTYSGLKHNIIDSADVNVPFPTEKSIVNLEQYIYDVFNVYNRVVRPYVHLDLPTEDDVPEGYSRVEYLESTGTQYIQTDVYAQSGDKVETNVMMTGSTGSNQVLVGTSWTSGSTGYFLHPVIFQDSSNKLGLGYRGTYYWGSAITCNTMYAVKSDMTRSAQYIEVDGTRSSFSNGNALSGGEKYTLFSNCGSSAAMARMKRTKIYDSSDTLVGDFEPMLRDADSEPGMYDHVTGTFYTNAGTGEFIYPDPEESTAITLALFNPVGDIEYEEDKHWDYSPRTMFDSWECIQNLDIVEETNDCNTVCIFSSDGTTHRGSYTVLEDGTIAQLQSGVAVADRYGVNCTNYVLDSDNAVLSLARAQLPDLQYNHKITFDILFSTTRLSDYSLGQNIRFWSGNRLYDTILTGWSYEIAEGSDRVASARFTLGKVRTTLTGKLNRRQ